MKNIFDKERLKEHIEEYLAIGKMYYEEEKGLKFLEAVIRYIYNSTEIKPEEVFETFKKIAEKGGEVTMTTAMRLMKEGLQQGLQEGGYRKAIETAKAMYKEKFKLEMIAKITGLSKEEIRRVVRLAN